VSAVTVTDALARHFRENVAGTKQAYSTGVTAGSVVLPDDIYDTTVVLVMWRAVDVIPGSFERATWTIDANAYFGGADTASAYAAYVAYADAVRVSIRTNWTLYGTATHISRWSGGPPEDVTVNGKDYVVVPFTFYVLEAGPTTYTA
jgi:hypothetical protein